MTEAVFSKTQPIAVDDSRARSIARVSFIDEARSREFLRIKAVKEAEAMAKARAETERAAAAETAARIQADADAVEEASVRIAVESKAKAAARERAKVEHDATTAALARLGAEATAAAAARSRMKAEEEASALAQLRAQAEAEARQAAEERIKAETEATDVARVRAAIEITARDDAAKRAKIQRADIDVARARQETERIALEAAQAEFATAENANRGVAAKEEHLAVTSEDEGLGNPTAVCSTEISAPFAAIEEPGGTPEFRPSATIDLVAAMRKPQGRGALLGVLVAKILLIACVGGSGFYLWLHPESWHELVHSAQQDERVDAMSLHDHGTDIPPAAFEAGGNEKWSMIDWNGWSLSSEMASTQEKSEP